ncbi:TolC family protein [Pontibacter sp. BT310]|uniref:TolC family protein n=1 Tax=Pontibacter populi TaxID=890055 RepID=A0ABS6XCR5_9BACT|nr:MULTISPECIES: TolC family protein [Pontibacter]MBJ6118914.1 TolC family protein [Pontibacter sp. BT310]MBR0571342.1 TolC family protein [Microvirga sp. STS03]MBW3365768.1 TolC family protein [Pontibacter populi]
MKSNFTCLVFVMLLCCAQSIAQPARQLGLQEVITMAQQQSATAKQADVSHESSYWQWRSFKSDYRPQLSLNGTLPDFSRTYTPVIQPDGTTDFKPVSINNSELGLTLRQLVGPTGGSIFVTSLMQRFDDFDRETTRYNGNPAIVGFEQPLFAFNPYAWARKVEPLRYQESQRKFVEDKETIAVEASKLYFDLLLAQVNQRIATQNLANNDTLYHIAEEKYKLGRLSKNDVLQLQLAVLNAQLAQDQATLDEQNATLALKTFVGLKDNDTLLLTIPDSIPGTIISAEVALAEAQKNRKEAISFKRRLLEAESIVAKAKGDNGLNMSVFATFGLSNSADNFSDVYTRPENLQRARIGFNMPLMDWGRQRSNYKVAELNRQLVQHIITQEEATFEQAVLSQANQYITLQRRLKTTAAADAIAQERYNITKNTFIVGRISITDLNIALSEKDQARRAYIASLAQFWAAHYSLRQLTLYDFENQQPIVAEINTNSNN